MNKWIRYILAVFEIVGGLMGMATIFVVGQCGLKFPIITLVMKMLITCVFILGIIGGIALLKNKRIGIVLSVFYQAFQIFFFGSPELSYSILSGLRLGVFHTNGKFYDIVDLGTSAHFGNLKPADNFTFGINFVATALFIYLIICLKDKSPEEKPIKTTINHPFLCQKCGRGFDESWKVCMYCRVPLVENPNYTPSSE